MIGAGIMTVLIGIYYMMISELGIRRKGVLPLLFGPNLLGRVRLVIGIILILAGVIVVLAFPSWGFEILHEN